MFILVEAFIHRIKANKIDRKISTYGVSFAGNPFSKPGWCYLMRNFRKSSRSFSLSISKRRSRIILQDMVESLSLNNVKEKVKKSL